MSSGGGDSQAGANPADKAKTDALYEDREPKKIIRIITVTAYMVSVSFVGIVLSAYYIFLWHPPNPRLMHAQAVSAHSEVHVDYLADDGSATGVASAGGLTPIRGADEGLHRVDSDRIIDLFGAPSAESESLKMRREIVKNVNAILRANFEKSRSTETPVQRMITTDALGVLALNDSLPTDGTHTLDNITESSAASSSESSVTSLNENTSGYSVAGTARQESTSGRTTATGTATMTSTLVLPTRRTRIPGKKQHQTPFALKHLEVPIKSDPTRRRPVRLTTTTTTTVTSATMTTATTRGEHVPMNTRGTSSDGTSTPVAPTLRTMDPSQASDNTNPQGSVKSLYKTLTSPSSSSRRDYPDTVVTDQSGLAMPSISSDQFEAAGPDYRDATIEPAADDLMDD